MPDTGDFGERMNSMPKYVVSTTLTNAEWKNTTIINKNVVEEIKKPNPSKQELLSFIINLPSRGDPWDGRVV